MSALRAILNPRAAGDAVTPTVSPDALSTLNNDIRVWRGVSIALGVLSVWLGVRSMRENARYRKALAEAARSRDARRAALKTLSE